MGAGTRAQVDSGLQLCWGSFFAAAAAVLRVLSTGSVYVGGRSGEGNGTPLQYSCLENPMDGGAW